MGQIQGASERRTGAYMAVCEEYTQAIPGLRPSGATTLRAKQPPVVLSSTEATQYLTHRSRVSKEIQCNFSMASTHRDH
jgi:hypothetical protein